MKSFKLQNGGKAGQPTNSPFVSGFAPVASEIGDVRVTDHEKRAIGQSVCKTVRGEGRITDDERDTTRPAAGGITTGNDARIATLPASLRRPALAVIVTQAESR